MDTLLIVYIIIPLVCFIVASVLPAANEKNLSRLVLFASYIQLAWTTLCTILWLVGGKEVINQKHFVLYKAVDFEFFLGYYYDRITAAFLVLSAVITLLICRFSIFYLHRDPGFKRFFVTLWLFITGYTVVVLSGNFETLFVGWEALGISSFLLISFYRERYLPVKNAFKVISLYRLSDVCLLLAIWMCHHVFHENITFYKLSSDIHTQEIVAGHSATGHLYLGFVLIMLFLTAAIKSALVPFSSWLPRAMEGPTSSSALFYGSLSVHLGLFVLLRTYPLWQGSAWFTGSLFILGILTAVMGHLIARVQPTVKTQIAYHTISQLGLISIEIAMGWQVLAIIHILSHSLLRVYQLLVSPSVLNYNIHHMVFHPQINEPKSFSRWRSAVYILSIKEMNMDALMYTYLWSPFKKTGIYLNSLFTAHTSWFTLFVFIAGMFYFLIDEHVHILLDHGVTLFYILVSLILVLQAFVETGPAQKAWTRLCSGVIMVSLAIAHNDHVPVYRILLYLSGIVLAAVAGGWILHKMNKLDKSLFLTQYHGYSYTHKKEALQFLICCLVLIGFPLTPTFLGIDLLFTHLDANQFVLTMIIALTFLFIELAALRIYSKIFLGRHKIQNHAMAFRSS